MEAVWHRAQVAHCHCICIETHTRRTHTHTHTHTHTSARARAHARRPALQHEPEDRDGKVEAGQQREWPLPIQSVETDQTAVRQQSRKSNVSSSLLLHSRRRVQPPHAHASLVRPFSFRCITVQHTLALAAHDGPLRGTQSTSGKPLTTPQSNTHLAACMTFDPSSDVMAYVPSTTTLSVVNQQRTTAFNLDSINMAQLKKQLLYVKAM